MWMVFQWQIQRQQSWMLLTDGIKRCLNAWVGHQQSCNLAFNHFWSALRIWCDNCKRHRWFAGSGRFTRNTGGVMGLSSQMQNPWHGKTKHVQNLTTRANGVPTTLPKWDSLAQQKRKEDQGERAKTRHWILQDYDSWLLKSLQKKQPILKML